MKKLTITDIEKIRAMRASGFTGKEIAKSLNVVERTIYYWTKRMKEKGMEAPTTRKRGGQPTIEL